MDSYRLEPITTPEEHPEFDASGYFAVEATELFGGESFYRMTVILPNALRLGRVSQIPLRISKISRTTLLPTELCEASSGLLIAGVGAFFLPLVAKTEPNTVFDDGWSSKNSRDPGPWQAHAKQSIVARKVTLAGWLTTSPERNSTK